MNTLRWTILESAEASLASALSLPREEVAQAAREFVAELRPTTSRAQQPGCEIWRASPRWHRLRAVVERVSATELQLREVLAHADWKPPSARPAPRSAAPASVVATRARKRASRPPQRPAAPTSVDAKPPRKTAAQGATAVSTSPDPPVLLRRRTPAAPAPEESSPASSHRGPATASVASALSTPQLLALHAALADWRRGGVWPGLTKLAAATELPRSRATALAAELEPLNLNQHGPTRSGAREDPLLVEVRGRIQRAIDQALRPLPATTWREVRIDVDRLAERIFVVTVTAGFATLDAVVEGLSVAKVEGVTHVARGVRAVIRA